MAKVYANARAEQKAIALVHDILVAGGVYDNRKKSAVHSFLTRVVTPICDELINRDFADIDASLQRLSGVPFDPSMDGSATKNATMTPESAAKALVFFASKIELYWDDTQRSTYEIDAFKNTMLGREVDSQGRFLSMFTGQPAASSSRTRAASRTTSGGAAGSTSGSSYKQSGPQSGNVRDLQGSPNQKVQAGTSVVYKVSTGSSTGPQAFIKPLSSSRSSISNGTNKVLISSGRGFGDCVCFFESVQEAKDFLDKLLQDNRVPSGVSLSAVRCPADRNGYFKVGTEFGTVLVRAFALNEALKEAAEQLNEADFTTEWDGVLESMSYEEKMTFFDKLLGD